jgi:predicted DNA-binding WGR domain protein
MTRFFTFKDMSSHKFWEITVEENKQTVSFGKVGANGSIKQKEFANNELCLVDTEKLIKEKMKKGYIETSFSMKIEDNQDSTYNDKILNYLTVQVESNKAKLNSYQDLHGFLREVYQEVQAFNFEEYKKKVETELEENVIVWTDIEKGFDPDEIISSILFEYDYFLEEAPEAASYGIVSWEAFKTHTRSFDMGYDYDFSSSIEASPGITLNFFGTIKKFSYHFEAELPEGIEHDSLFYMNGYSEIVNICKLTGFIALHQVLAKLTAKGTFDKIKMKKGFMFMIGEHDMGEVFPLFVTNK